MLFLDVTVIIVSLFLETKHFYVYIQTLFFWEVLHMLHMVLLASFCKHVHNSST